MSTKEKLSFDYRTGAHNVVCQPKSFVINLYYGLGKVVLARLRNMYRVVMAVLVELRVYCTRHKAKSTLFASCMLSICLNY